jgi:serine/threonine-protein kinase HipA
MTLPESSRKLTKSDFINLGLKFQLTEKQILNTFKQFVKVEKIMKQVIKSSFLSMENQVKNIELLENRLLLLNGQLSSK